MTGWDYDYWVCLRWINAVFFFLLRNIIIPWNFVISPLYSANCNWSTTKFIPSQITLCFRYLLKTLLALCINEIKGFPDSPKTKLLIFRIMSQKSYTYLVIYGWFGLCQMFLKLYPTKNKLLLLHILPTNCTYTANSVIYGTQPNAIS